MIRMAMMVPITAIAYAAWFAEAQSAQDIGAWSNLVSNVGIPVAFVTVFMMVSAYAAWKIVPKIVQGMDMHMDSVRELRETSRTNRDTLRKLEELLERTDRRLEFLEKSVLAALSPPGRPPAG